jgi:hypothetical protein
MKIVTYFSSTLTHQTKIIMKKLNFILMIAGIAMLMISSCDLIDDVTLNPDETVAKEGNYWTAQASGYSNTTATVSQNDKGLAKIDFNYDGQDYSITAKVTKTKIEDYVYSGGDEKKGFTLVDFDANVGAKWEYTVGTETVTREVTYKSTEDDYMVYGLGMMIKVVQVEETIPEGVTIGGYTAGAKKILWTFNHKFGWIGAEVTKTDNSVVYVGLNSTNAGQ